MIEGLDQPPVADGDPRDGGDIAEGGRIYVSVTGLRLKRFWHRWEFSRLAMAAMMQARAAPGCLMAEGRGIDGVHHTRSAWASREAMLAFLHSGAHLEAVCAFHRIATGKTYGAEMAEMPDWDTLHRLWQIEGRDYLRVADSPDS